MIENRWLLFAVYFVSLLVVRIIYLRNNNIHIAEHIFIAFFTAATMAYLDKYFKRLIVYLVQKIVPKLTRAKSKD